MSNKIIPSPYVSDIALIKRSWSERLFSWSWRPLKKYRSIDEPKVYYLEDGSILCSYKTYAQIKDGRIKLPYDNLEEIIKQANNHDDGPNIEPYKEKS